MTIMSVILHPGCLRGNKEAQETLLRAVLVTAIAGIGFLTWAMSSAPTMDGLKSACIAVLVGVVITTITRRLFARLRRDGLAAQERVVLRVGITSLTGSGMLLIGHDWAIASAVPTVIMLLADVLMNIDEEGGRITLHLLPQGAGDSVVVVFCPVRCFFIVAILNVVQTHSSVQRPTLVQATSRGSPRDQNAWPTSHAFHG